MRRRIKDDVRMADITCLDKRIRNVMLSGRIKAVLPVSSVDDGGRIIAIYSVRNMMCAADGEYSPVNILELTGRIIKMLEELEDILIRPEDIVLDTKVIFIDPVVRKTRICIIPSHTKEGSSKECVSYLLEELKELTDERGKAYLEVFMGEYKSRHLSVDALMSFIEELKREAGMEQ